MANLTNTKPLDLVAFFTDLAALWTEQGKCDSCWSFGAPLSEAGMNRQQPETGEECCIHLILTNYRMGSAYRYSPQTEQQNYKSCDHHFILYAVMQRSDIGQNVFNEISGHPITESLWAESLSKIAGCLGCGRELELCELGYDFDILSWSMESVLLKGDQNWTGWKITGSFRTKKFGH